MSWLRRKTIFSAGISGKQESTKEYRKFPIEIEDARRWSLVKDLKSKGYPAEQAQGRSRENPYEKEKAVVTRMTRTEAIRYGHRYGQGSVIWGSEMIQTHGKPSEREPNRKSEGTTYGEAALKKDYYTKPMGRKKPFSMRFRFD